MKYIFILNIFTLRNNIKILCKKISRICKEKDIDYVIEINSKKKSTEDIVKKYKRKKVILAPVGGDGIINRVLNSMDKVNNRLCPIPYGTGNDLCRTIRRHLKNGVTKVDIVKINSKYYINNACFGIDSDIANSDIISNSKIPKSMRYNISAIDGLFRYKLKYFKIYINNEIISGIKSTIIVSNGMYYGGGYKVSPHSKLNDGYLEVYIVDKMPKTKILLLMLGINQGKHEESKDVRLIKTKSVRIVTKEKIKCNIDGEILKSDDFKIEIVEKGIELFYNKELIEEILH